MDFTDIHCHLAWDIDDGMPSEGDAETALAMAAEDGIKKIISTPHLYPGYADEEKFDQINRRIDDLKVLGGKYGIQVVRGCEFLLNDEAMNWIDRKLYNKIENTEYLLCEFNPRMDISEIPYADDMLYELQTRGITPVIAHAERYFHHIDCDRIRRWIRSGCYIQVNRTSIMGYQGKDAQKNSIELLKQGLCHFVATDAHRAKGTRVMCLSDAYEKTVSIAGKENADLIFKENPAKLINNQEPEGMTVVKQGFFSRLKGKR